MKQISYKRPFFLAALLLLGLSESSSAVARFSFLEGLTKNTHLYVGAYGGAIFWQTSSALNLRYPDNDTVPPSQRGKTYTLAPQSAKKSALIGGVVLGASHMLSQHVNLASEFTFGNDFVSASKTEQPETATSASKVTQKLTEDMGVALLPGYQFSSDYTAFLKIGYNLVRFKSEATSAGYLGPHGDNAKWVGGMTYGAGIQYLLRNHWVLRGEYDYTDYNHFAIQGGLDKLASGYVKSAYTMHSNKVIMLVAYQF